METVYDYIKRICAEDRKEELASLVREIYNAGWFDGSLNVDNEDWMFADYLGTEAEN